MSRPTPPPRPDRARSGLPAQLLGLADELRREGVAIGTAELLDAFGALREVDWTSEHDFREALAATLAKSPEDRRVFELVFERFLFRATEIAALGPEAEQEARAHDARDGSRRREEDASRTGHEWLLDDELSPADLDALRASIAAALQDAAGGGDGADAAMRDLARLAIAAFARRQEGSGVIGVDVQRVRRALDLRAEAASGSRAGRSPPRRGAARRLAALRSAAAQGARSDAGPAHRAASARTAAA